MKKVDNFIDKFLDIFFSKDKSKLYLILIIILGFILRVISAINMRVYADDMHFAVHAINFLESGKLETYDQSCGLWFAITDIFYKLFGGATQFASRFASVLFGTLLIIGVFLLAKEFFNKKIALISAFLVAVSPFAVKAITADMDPTVIFFIVFSLLFFIEGIKKNKNLLFYTSATLLGVAIMIKVYALLFIPGFLFFYFYIKMKTRQKEKKIRKLNKEDIKKIFVFLFIIFIFCTPTLIHNYLLYKDKGIMDLQFTRIFGFGKEKSAQYYSWDVQFDNTKTRINLKNFFFGNEAHNHLPHGLVPLKWVLYSNPLIFILGGVGLLYLFKKQRNYFVLFFSLCLIPLFYLTNVILLPKHFLFIIVFLSIPAAFFVNWFNNRIQNKFTKFKLIYIIFLILIFSLFYLGLSNIGVVHFYAKDAVSQMFDYKENIADDTLILTDSRIYTGQSIWMFNDKYFLDVSKFQELLNLQEQLPGNVENINVYFIECALDDCGWGTIATTGQELNKSMEQYVEIFNNKSNKKIEIYSPYPNKNCWLGFCEKRNHFNIYKIEMPLKKSSLQVADSTHTFFLYPLKYNENLNQIFDKYDIHTTFDKLLNKFGFLVTYFAIIIVFLSIFLCFYKFIIN